MGRFDVKPEDYDKAIEDGEKAGDAGSMFIAKRLKDDLNCIYITFLEIPSFGKVVYDGVPSEKGQANVVSWGKDGNELEEGAYILEMAPTHINRFLAKLRKPQYGLAKVYEIERHGAKGFQKTYYELEIIRDLTPDEIDKLEQVELHELFTRQGDGDTAPATTTTALPVSTEFNNNVGTQMKRLGWTPQDVKHAIKTYFQGDITTGAEMSHAQRDAFIVALQRLSPGDAPASIGYQETGEPLNLDEDIDFF